MSTENEHINAFSILFFVSVFVSVSLQIVML